LPSPRLRTNATTRLQQGFGNGGMGFNCHCAAANREGRCLQGVNICRNSISAFGPFIPREQKWLKTSHATRACQQHILLRSFDHSICERKDLLGNFKAYDFGRLEVDDEL
jgi:hypothetical protein